MPMIGICLSPVFLTFLSQSDFLSAVPNAYDWFCLPPVFLTFLSQSDFLSAPSKMLTIDSACLLFFLLFISIGFSISSSDSSTTLKSLCFQSVLSCRLFLWFFPTNQPYQTAWKKLDTGLTLSSLFLTLSYLLLFGYRSTYTSLQYFNRRFARSM